MSDTTNKIEQRIEGRRLADNLLSVIEGDTFTHEAIRGFWSQMLDRCPEHYKPQQPLVNLLTMTDEQAARFESETIGFGAHSGKLYRDVPIDYLTWLSDESLPLKAYLRSKRGKRRIERGE